MERLVRVTQRFATPTLAALPLQAATLALALAGCAGPTAGGLPPSNGPGPATPAAGAGGNSMGAAGIGGVGAVGGGVGGGPSVVGAAGSLGGMLGGAGRASGQSGLAGNAGTGTVSPVQDPPGVQAARGVLSRLIGPRAKSLALGLLPPRPSGKDVFEVQAQGGQLSVRGTSPVAICRGFYEYLKAHHMGIVSWSGIRLALPDRWPDLPLRQVASPYRYHYYFNVVTYGYTLPYWSWERWERELPAPEFMRTHRSAIVRVDAILGIEADGSAYRVLVRDCEAPVPVARGRGKDVKLALEACS